MPGFDEGIGFTLVAGTAHPTESPGSKLFLAA